MIVVINHTMHDDILKDLKYLRNIFRERARSDLSNTNDDAILSRLFDYIEHMESCPNRAGKLLGVTVKKSLLLKIALSFSAACASAILRAGLQDGGGE